jgi:hypothetical protein
MAIKFFTQEDKTFDGKPRVREYFETDLGQRGLVDEAIIKQHPREYAKFKAPPPVEAPVKSKKSKEDSTEEKKEEK